jgi:hypothetical protein
MKNFFYLILVLNSSCGVNIFQSDPSERADKIEASAIHLENKRVEDAQKLLLTMIPESAKSILQEPSIKEGYYKKLSAALSEVEDSDLIFPLLADSYISQAGVGIISFLMGLASKAEAKSGCDKQQNFIFKMSKNISKESAAKFDMILKAQYLVDVLTISSSYDDNPSASISFLKTKPNSVNSSISIKAVTYDFMAMLSLIKHISPNTIKDISDDQARAIRRSFIHLKASLAGAGSSTFKSIEKTQTDVYQSTIGSKENEGNDPLNAFKLWILFVFGGCK